MQLNSLPDNSRLAIDEIRSGLKFVFEHHCTRENLLYDSSDIQCSNQMKDTRPEKHQNAGKKSTRKSSPLSTSSANKRNNIDKRNNNQSRNNNISDATMNNNVLLEIQR